MKPPEELWWWLRLLAVPGIGPVRYRELLGRFGGPREVFDAPLEQIARVSRVDARSAGSIKGFDDPKRFADAQLEKARGLSAAILTIDDPEYPSNLRLLPDAPPVLFMRGGMADGDARAVAIVGSRDATIYGKRAAHTLARELCGRGFCIVSGMARGIDSAAHQGALVCGGRTIAVLGCGVDVVYPAENRQLRDDIIARGAVLSEYPIGEEPLAAHFPNRNRVITGLSLGVVAVEARADSGVFSSVRWAADQGKDVFAVPGPINSPASLGTNRLIKQGAKLVQDVGDILEELLIGGPLKTPPPEPPKPQLSDDEQPVYQLLSDSPAHIDAIAQGLSLKTSDALRILLSLEMRDLVRQLPGKRFVRM